MHVIAKYRNMQYIYANMQMRLIMAIYYKHLGVHEKRGPGRIEDELTLVNEYNISSCLIYIHVCKQYCTSLEQIILNEIYHILLWYNCKHIMNDEKWEVKNKKYHY